MFNTYMDKINEIINKRCYNDNNVMYYPMSNGNKVEFNIYDKSKPIWKSLKEQNSYMYNKIVDEIFDEIHPY